MTRAICWGVACGRAGDGVHVTDGFETLDQARVQHFGQHVRPLGPIENRTFPVCRADDDFFRFKNAERRRLGDEELAGGEFAGLGRGARSCQIENAGRQLVAAAAGQPFEARDDAVDTVGVAGQCGGELVDAADGAAHLICIIGQHRIHAAQNVARGLAHRLPRSRLSDKMCCVASGHCKSGGVRRAPGEDDDGRAGKPLEVDANARVGPHRR